jgi:hypothetical protein
MASSPVSAMTWNSCEAVAADGAGVGRHRAVGQADAVEDALVGGEHHLS